MAQPVTPKPTHSAELNLRLQQGLPQHIVGKCSGGQQRLRTEEQQARLVASISWQVAAVAPLHPTSKHHLTYMLLLWRKYQI